jgi:hypothetical protein
LAAAARLNWFVNLTVLCMASPGQQFVVDFPVGSVLMGSGQFCLAVLLDSVA